MSDLNQNFDPEIIAAFLDEAPGYVSVLDEGLLTLEQSSGDWATALRDPEVQRHLNEMFRAAHSLKGLAASLGFDNIRDLTHRMETLFDRVRTGKHELDPRTVQALFGVFDTLKRLVQDLTQPPQVPTTIHGALAELDDILNSRHDDAPPPTAVARAGGAVETENDCDIAAGDGVSATACATAPDSGESDANSAVAMEDDAETIQLFISTTIETLECLTNALIAMEEAPGSAELVNVAFRAAHNIKAATGAVGLTAHFRLTHDMETVLDKVRCGSLDLSAEVMAAMLAAVDCLKRGVARISKGRAADGEADVPTGLFDNWTCPNARPPAEAPAIADAGGEAITEFKNAGDACCAVTVIFPKDHKDASIQAYLILNKLKDVADVIQTVPDVNALDAESSIERVRYDIHPNVTVEEIKESVSKYTTGTIVISEGTAPGPAAHESAAPSSTVGAKSSPATEGVRAGVALDVRATTDAGQVTQEARASESTARPLARKPATDASRNPVAAAASAVPKPVETIRVDLERLDQLMNLGGELVINRARLLQIRGRFDSVFEQGNARYLIEEVTDHINRLQGQIARSTVEGVDSHAVTELANNVAELAQDFASIRELVEQVNACRPVMNDFGEALHSLSLISDGIQQRIMETRMVAIGPMFQRFRRVVRDISKSTGKHVELVLHGESTELDKRMIDELGDPLTHMIRNSVDHGIELPEERVRLGKPPTACVSLNAYHRGRHICIEVKDNGRGVNIEAVKRKVVEKELATAADVERMTEKELVQFIFKPGFSTAETVTDLSGRGMGMDIVMTKLDALNGTVDVESVTGVGTTVTIRLPLTLAIITAILARIGDGAYAIPLESVAEIITIPRDTLQRVARRNVIRVRNRVIRVVCFEDVFMATVAGLHTRSKLDPNITLVILSLQNEQIGLVVDQLIGQEDVVIKSIADNFKNILGISGASIMGDGSVSLIMDVPSMFNMLAERRDQELDIAQAGATDRPAARPASELETALAT